MNKTVANFTREQIKTGLKQLPESWQFLFKRMYSHNNLELDIDTVVYNIPDEKLERALQQVENSLENLKR